MTEEGSEPGSKGLDKGHWKNYAVNADDDFYRNTVTPKKLLPPIQNPRIIPPFFAPPLVPREPPYPVFFGLIFCGLGNSHTLMYFYIPPPDSKKKFLWLLTWPTLSLFRSKIRCFSSTLLLLLNRFLKCCFIAATVAKYFWWTWSLAQNSYMM